MYAEYSDLQSTVYSDPHAQQLLAYQSDHSNIDTTRIDIEETVRSYVAGFHWQACHASKTKNDELEMSLTEREE